MPARRHRIGEVGGRRELILDLPLRIGAVPVTCAQYAAFDPQHEGPRFGGDEEELGLHPVADVTWYEAVSFCRWLDRQVPGCSGARLPTAEEWETACRAGTESVYWSGDQEDDLAGVGWYSENSEYRTHRVGEKPANAWGLYDVHGNVWEWTQTRIADRDAEPEAGGPDPTSGRRVIRGGSFDVGAGLARSAVRLRGEPGHRSVYLGFRVVLPAPCRDSTLDP